MAYLPPINFNPNMPALFGQGLTDYEILVRVFKVINENAQKLDSFEKIVEEIKNLLTDFDNTLQQKVIEYIQELYNNGTLEEIIKEVLQPLKDTLLTGFAPMQTIDFHHQFRHIFYTGNNWINISSSDINYANCQGGCSFIRNGMTYNAFVMHDIRNRIGRLYVFENDKNDVVWYADLNTPHANSCVYNPSDDCLYIPRFYSSHNLTNDTYVQSNGIFKVSFDTHQVELKNISTNDDSPLAWYSVKKLYNKELRKWELIGFKNLHQYYNGGIYNRVYKIDYESGTTTLIDEYTLPNFNTNSQGRFVYLEANCAINDKFIVAVTSRPNSIVLYERSEDITNIDRERKPLWTYTIPDTLGYSYPLGEIEDIELDNAGTIQMVTYNFLNSDIRPDPNNLTTVVRMYKTSITKGNNFEFLNFQNQADPHTAYFRWANSIQTMYVDSNSPFTNPSGERTQPFKTTQEAIEYIKACPFINEGRINLISNDNLPCFIATNKNIRIDIGGNVIGGIYCKSGNLLATNGTITQTSNYSGYVQYNAPLYITDNSKVICNQIQFDSNANQMNGVKCNQDVYIAQSDIYIASSTSSSGGLYTVTPYRSRVTP